MYIVLNCNFIITIVHLQIKSLFAKTDYTFVTFLVFFYLIKITQLQFDWDLLECTVKFFFFENC